MSNEVEKYEYRKKVLQRLLTEWKSDNEVVVAPIPNDPYINNLAIYKDHQEFQAEENAASSMNHFQKYNN